MISAGSSQYLASALQEGPENANIDAGLRFHLENLGSKTIGVHSHASRIAGVPNSSSDDRR
jgi:hypothetical protein